jgi:pimeloyl-ACP methyl ester carboxylesterase
MWSAVTAASTMAVAVAVYATLAWPSIAAGASPWPWLLGIPAVYLTLVALFVAWYFALAWRYRSPRPPGRRIGVAATLRLVAVEYVSIAGAPLRMIAYRLLVPTPSPAPATLPLLLVHGVLCNAGVWSTFVRRFRAAGVGPVYGLSYGPPLASIDGFADQMHAMIARIRADTGASQVMVVAHSMGGLVALACLRRYGYAAVRRLVTIGTPWHGSIHARFFPGVALSQLRPRNPWLRELDPRAPAQGPPVASIWSWHDSMVAPQTSSRLPGAIDVELTGIGHNALLRDPQVLQRVLDEYRAASSTGESPGSASRESAAAASAGRESAAAASTTSESPASAARTPSARR